MQIITYDFEGLDAAIAALRTLRDDDRLLVACNKVFSGMPEQSKGQMAVRTQQISIRVKEITDATYLIAENALRALENAREIMETTDETIKKQIQLDLD